MDQSDKSWGILIKSCIERRLSAEQFEKFVKQLSGRSPISGSKIAAVFLERSTQVTNWNDPRLPLYLDILLDTSLLDSADILNALLLHSTTQPRKHSDEQHDAPSRNSALQFAPQLESSILLQLTRKYLAGSRPQSQTEARMTFRSLHEWTSAIVAHMTNESMMHALGAEVQQQDQFNGALIRDAIGQLLIAVLENVKMAGILETRLTKGARKALARSISSFIPLWLPFWPQLAARLELAQKSHRLIDEKGETVMRDNGLDMALVQVESIADLPLMRTRAHLYVLITAMTVGLPLTDEATILGYLNFVYKGDTSSMITDLITASFDALSGAQSRHETEHVMFGLRSFLINRVPTILAILLASTFQGLNMEYCITAALSNIDATAFPSFSDSFLDSASPLSDVRLDFVFSCTRHGLLPVSSVDRLLGETPMTTAPTPAEKYQKEQLIAQCTTNPDKIEAYVAELEKVDGNAGPIALAITDMLRTYCVTKETMSLKSLCNSLSRRPLSMDVVLQFTSCQSILQPLCELLDGWRYEEDQGEYQPVYDEFAAILLLVLAFVHRYSLDIYDIGISSSSFIAKMLAKGHVSRPLDDLSTAERKYLDDWILGLFNPEGEGISDEVMSGCRPQDFYLLLPTIVSQSVMALTSNVLDMKTIKGGFEYLSLPFLFPSVIGTILWLCDYVWEQNHTNGNAVVQLFQKLVKPPSSSSSSGGDLASAMHTTIMQIVFPKLEGHLQMLDRRDPKLHSSIDSLRQMIQPYRGFQVGRTFENAHGLAKDVVKTSGSLQQNIKACIQSLTIWSVNASMAVPGMPIVQPPPPLYSPRALQMATKLLGPSAVVRAVAEELRAQTDLGNGAVAVDVATALICAPMVHDSPIIVSWISSPAAMPTRSRSSLNLREALQLAFEDAPILTKSDEQLAQAIVRLHRRVEALCIGASVSGDGGLTAAAAAAAAVGAGAVVNDLAMDTAAAAQMQLDDAMGLNVASAVDPMTGLLSDDPLQQQQNLFDPSAGMDASAMNLTAADLTVGSGNDATADLDMELMPDGDDDIFGGLGDLNFD